VTRAAFALALALSGCAATAGPYQQYRAAHPEWDGAFPTADADVTRTIAALHAPGRNFVGTVSQLSVWRLAAGTWTRIEPDAASDAGDFGVTAYLHCQSDDGTTRFMRGLSVWYLLPNGALAAWDHYAFQPGCDVANSFEPASGARVADEAALLKRAGLPALPTADGAAEFYEKGRAFLRAGRREEAEAMLSAGDSSGKGGFDVRARFNSPRSARHESSAADARAALVRELGGSQ
jgi:hypothetical protein